MTQILQLKDLGSHQKTFHGCERNYGENMTVITKRREKVYTELRAVRVPVTYGMWITRGYREFESNQNNLKVPKSKKNNKLKMLTYCYCFVVAVVFFFFIITYRINHWIKMTFNNTITPRNIPLSPHLNYITCNLDEHR